MNTPQQIVTLVNQARYEDALELPMGASHRDVDRRTMSLAMKFRSDQAAWQAINTAASELKNEKGQPQLWLSRMRGIGRTLSDAPGGARDSIRYLETAAAVGAEGSDFHWLGATLLQLSRLQDALPHLEKAANQRGEAIDHKLYASALCQMQRETEAIPHLKEVARLAPEAETCEILSVLFWKMGKIRQAAMYAEEASLLSNGTSQVGTLIGQALCDPTSSRAVVRTVRPASPTRSTPPVAASRPAAPVAQAAPRASALAHSCSKADRTPRANHFGSIFTRMGIFVYRALAAAGSMPW